MKKLIVIIALLFTTATYAQTEERSVRHIEIEPSIGIATEGFITFGIEGRYNFNYRP